MIVTSDNTPLRAIITATSTGSPTRTNPAAPTERDVIWPPMTRPTTTKIRTGRKIEPNAPMGSRRKILISNQVSFQSPRNIALSLLIPNRMAGQFQKDVLQVRQHGAKVGDPDPVLGQTLDHFGHKVVAMSLNCK